MTVMAALLIVASGFAQAPACPANSSDFVIGKENGTITYTPSSSLPVTKVAVASNFFCPAVRMVYNYLQSNINNVKVTVHHDSTGTLINQITNDPGHDIYDNLFTADSIPGSFLTAIGKTQGDTILYAKGIPSHFGYKTGYALVGIDSVLDLIDNLAVSANNPPDNFVVTENGGYLEAKGYTVNHKAENVAIAVTPAAPYGTAAAAIFSEFATAPAISGPWNNIATTYDKVGTAGIPSGVVSKAQICADIASGRVSHVDFTGYTLGQEAIQLTANGEDLIDWIFTQMSNGGWNTFLTQHCYGTVP